MIYLPDWLPGPYQVTLTKEGDFRIASHVETSVAVSEDRLVDDDLADRDIDGYLQFGEGVESGTHHQSTAKLIAMAPRMADVLAQWVAAEAEGDNQEMQNAINERDDIIQNLLWCSHA